MADKVLITQEGLEELKAQLDTLLHETRAEVIQELQEARAQGDLSENADYDAARERQAMVEAQIRELENQIKNAEIIETTTASGKANYVRLGTTVTIKDYSDNSEASYTIVGTVEADPINGRISNDSPFAKAILDRKLGDVVTIKTANEPYQVEILKIE